MSEQTHYTAQQLAGLPGMPATDRGVRILAKKQKWENRKKAVGKGVEYPFSTLPAATAAYLTKEHLQRNGALEKARVADGGNQEALSKAQRQRVAAANLVELNGLPEKAQVKALAKVAVLNAREAFLAGGDSICASEAIFIEAYNKGELDFGESTYKLIPSISRPTVRRWAKVLKEQGAGALAEVRRKPIGQSLISQQPELEQFLVALVTAKPHLLNQANKLQDLIAVKAGEYEWQVPSVSSVRRWAVRWYADNQAMFSYLTNPDAYNSKHRPLFGRMYPWLTGPNQIWEFDSTPTDVMLNASGKLKRYSIIAAIDVYTRRPMVILSPTSDSEGICLLLRKCLLEWGMLESDGLARTDNGSDYVSQRVSTILDMLQITQSKTRAFSGWEKPYIERFFRTLSAKLLEILPGYIGHSVQDRQQIEAAKAFAQRIGAKNRRQNEKEALELALTPAELQTLIDGWIQNSYMHTQQSGFKDELTEKTPFEVFTESGYKPKLIPDPHALDLLLNNVGEATVTRGYVKSGGIKYTAPELMESSWDKQRVRVFLDPTDVGRATLYPLGDFGSYVEATNMDLIGRDIDPTAYRTARKANKKLMSDFRKTSKQLQERFNIDGIWAEKLAQEAQQRAGLTALPLNSGNTDNPTIAGLTAAIKKPDEGYSEAELKSIERQRQALAERKEQTEKQLQKVTRDAHEQARWLVDESLERELREHEKQWLKKYRLDNPLMAKSLDRRHEKATRNRAG